MSYKVVCIGSRHITNEVNERMLRTLAVLKHVSSNTELRVLATSYTPFEVHFEREFKNLGIGTTTIMESNKLKNIEGFVQKIHKQSRKISKYKFKQLCKIACSIYNADLVVAVPRNGKGRGAFALRVASALFTNSLDLTSSDTELKLQQIEKEITQQNRRIQYAKEMRERSYKKKLEALKEKIRNSPTVRRYHSATIDSAIVQLEKDFIKYEGKFKPVGVVNISVNPTFKVMWQFKKNLYVEKKEAPKKPDFSNALIDALNILQGRVNNEPHEPEPPRPEIFRPIFQWGQQPDRPVEARVDYQQPWREAPPGAGRVEGNTVHITQNDFNGTNDYIAVPDYRGTGANTFNGITLCGENTANPYEVRYARDGETHTIRIGAHTAATTNARRQLEDMYQRGTQPRRQIQEEWVDFGPDDIIEGEDE